MNKQEFFKFEEFDLKKEQIKRARKHGLAANIYDAEDAILIIKNYLWKAKNGK